MSKTAANTAVIAGAIGAALLAVSQTTNVFSSKKEVVAGERERCYGVAKAGKNDCGTSRHSCAGNSTSSSGLEEWLMLPKGTCEKIVGGSLKNLALSSDEPGPGK